MCICDNYILINYIIIMCVEGYNCLDHFPTVSHIGCLQLFAIIKNNL